MIQFQPVFLTHPAVFDITVDLQDIRIEIMDRHDTPAFLQSFRVIGTLCLCNQFFIGRRQLPAETFHIFIGQPQTDTCPEIMIP